MTDDREQNSDDRRQMTENRGQMTDDRWQRTEDRRQKTDDREQNSDDRRQMILRTEIGKDKVICYSLFVNSLTGFRSWSKKGVSDAGQW